MKDCILPRWRYIFISTSDAKPLHFKKFPLRINFISSISHCFHLLAMVINLSRFGEEVIEPSCSVIGKQGEFQMVLHFVMLVSFCWQTEVIWNTEHLLTSLSLVLTLFNSWVENSAILFMPGIFDWTWISFKLSPTHGAALFIHWL